MTCLLKHFMSPTTSSVAQNIFYAQNVLLILLTSAHPFFKYYNILKRKKNFTKEFIINYIYFFIEFQKHGGLISILVSWS